AWLPTSNSVLAPDSTSQVPIQNSFWTVVKSQSKALLPLGTIKRRNSRASFPQNGRPSNSSAFGIRLRASSCRAPTGFTFQACKRLHYAAQSECEDISPGDSD